MNSSSSQLREVLRHKKGKCEMGRIKKKRLLRCEVARLRSICQCWLTGRAMPQWLKLFVLVFSGPSERMISRD